MENSPGPGARPARVLIVHNDYREAGGERVAVEAQITALRKRGHDVLTYLRHNDEINDFNLLDKARFFREAVDSPRTARELRELVRKERPDVAHVHNVFPLITPSAYRALSDAGVPIVQTIHNFRLLCPSSTFFTHNRVCERCKHGSMASAVRLRCYRGSVPLSALYATTISLHRKRGTFGRVDRFIALTEFVARKLRESGLLEEGARGRRADGRVQVLGNFLPDPLPPPSDGSAKLPYLVYVGRLSYEKGVHTLIEAMNGFRGFGLKVLGTGPAEEALRARAAQLGLDHVEFLGYVAGDGKRDLVRDASACVIPSVWYENLPYSLLESMSLGTAVVLSDAGSLATVIEDGVQGTLFRSGDPDDLREKLRALAAAPDVVARQGRAGRDLVARSYNEGSHYAALIKIYEDVARGGP